MVSMRANRTFHFDKCKSLSQASVCHFCMSVPESCCYVDRLYTIPRLTIRGVHPNWQQVKWRVQLHRGQWEWEQGHEEAGLWVTQHRVSHASLQGRVTDRLVFGSVTVMEKLESKPWLERHSTCVHLTGLCADEPTHLLSQKSHMQIFTDLCRRTHF